MTDWTGGYVTDVGYTFGYYEALNPLRVRLPFLNAGLSPPEFETACELGFGHGLSINLHSAASLTRWHGTDFNPSHALFAQQLAAASGAGARLYDDAFQDFVHRSDLPDFDFVGLHGTWSWVSDENRTTIVDFLRRKLKVGGVLYISYNTLPGCASFAPVRELLLEYSDKMGVPGRGTVNRFDDALAFFEKVIAAQPKFAQTHPDAFATFNQLKAQTRNYGVHEYLNRDWVPMNCSQLAAWLKPAKLQYAASANLIDQLEGTSLSPQQLALLNEIPDPILRETLYDFILNRRFRLDYWIKGSRPLPLLEQEKRLRALRIILMTPRPDVALKAATYIGEMTMSETIFNPILDALADHEPKALGQLESALKERGISLSVIVQSVIVLVSGGHVCLVQDEAVAAKTRGQTDRLNGHLTNQAQGNWDVGFLASPVSGGGVRVQQYQQLFLHALRNGRKLPEEWAELTLQVMTAQGRKIVRGGKTLETEDESRQALLDDANTFAKKQLPILKALQVV